METGVATDVIIVCSSQSCCLFCLSVFSCCSLASNIFTRWEHAQTCMEANSVRNDVKKTRQEKMFQTTF